MDDFSLIDIPQKLNKAPETDFYIATVAGVSSSGVRLLFAGESSATSKYYKCLDSANVSTGDRVVAMKQSGTYIVLGTIGRSGSDNVEITTNSSDIFSSITSGFTVLNPVFAKYGKVAMFTTLIKASSAGSTTDWKVWATLKSGKRPCMVTLAKCQATNFCEINTNGQIQFSLKESANYNYRISATFLLA